MIRSTFLALALVAGLACATPPEPFSQPREAKAGAPDAGGVVTLAASQAAIVGESLACFEPGPVLGRWTAAEDQAVFRAEGLKGGFYRVEIVYAATVFGNQFVLEIDGLRQRLHSATEDTGGPDRFQAFVIGSLFLPRGAVTLRLRPEGALRGELMRFRQLRLVPSL